MSRPPDPVNTITVFDLVQAHDDVQDFLDQLAVLSAHNMTPADVVCGISYQDWNTTTTLASSDPAVEVMNERQHGNGAGPGLSSMKTGAITVIDDTTTETRWPAYLQSVTDYGYRSMMSVPLLLTDSSRTSINFYATDPGIFTPERQMIARNFAATATKALALVLQLSSSSNPDHDLLVAIGSRSPINVAIGAIMGQNRCGQDEAFEILRSASNNQNVKVRVLAQQIIDRAAAAPANH